MKNKSNRHLDENECDNSVGDLWSEPCLKKLFYGLILGLALNAIDCKCQDVLPAWRTNFQAYLTNRPWVADIEYDWSRNHEFSSDPNEKPLEGIETFRASLQSGGYFLQYQSATNLPPRNRLLVTGESTNDYWQITVSGIGFAPKNPAQGGSISNTIPIICAWQRQNLLDVLNLGIAGLDTASIEWSSPTNFTANSLSDEGVQAGRIQGQIEAFDQGLPSRLRYTNTYAFYKNEERVILYHYDNPFLPPSETTIQVWSNKKEIIDLKNVINHVSFGLGSEAEKGFLLTAFLPSSYVPARMLIQSNGLRYEIQADSGLKLWEPTKEAMADFYGIVKPQHSPWIFIVFTLVGATIILMLLARKRRK